MNFGFNYLKALVHTGLSLDIRTEQTGRTAFKITEKHKGEFTFDQLIRPDAHSFSEEIERAFRHYPSPVTVDGEEITRTSFPGLARVNTVTATGNLQNHRKVDRLLIGDDPETRDVNLFAGGILSSIKESQAVSRNHMAHLPGERRHWNPAMMVIIHPIQVILDHEFLRMSEEEFNDITENEPATALGRAMAGRDLEQIKRTLAHPDMPARHNGPVYSYLTTRPGYADEGFGRGGPIIISDEEEKGEKREPVVFHQRFQWDPETIALAEGMYRNPTGFVPVAKGFGRDTGEQSYGTIGSYGFDVTAQFPTSETSQENPGFQRRIRAVAKIDATFQIEGDTRTHHVPVPFLFHGEDLEEMEVMYVLGQVTPDDLATHIVRAYGIYNEYVLDEHCQEKMDEMTETVRDLVWQAMDENAIPA